MIQKHSPLYQSVSLSGPFQSEVKFEEKPMPITHIAPVIAAIILIGALITITAREGRPFKGAWKFAALGCVLFTVWSLWAVVTEGPFGFWPEHIRNLWGNQIWFDLLLAVTVAWAMLIGPAKRLGMNLWLWMIFIICTGSIGLTATAARYLYLREKEL